MLLIGETCNSSVPRTLELLNTHNEAGMIELIKRQEAAGTHYLDINTALTGERELADMKWVVDLAIRHSKCNIMLDSPNWETIEAMLPVVAGRDIMINSITADEKFIPVYDRLRETDVSIVCLPIKGREIPSEPETRLKHAGELIEKLTQHGIPAKRIYIDVLVEAAASSNHAGTSALETLRLIQKNYPEVNTICGLSNISFGLPRRALLNAAFLLMARALGITAAILDVTSERMKEAIAASEVLLGHDEYCLDYIHFVRDGRS